ncbi:MAG: methyltransferase domain-containing protein [Candidatus Latescibacteria bacterium]|nr:methyltransferase domain-containing protein [Candidatus Latescibacterota bacterium]
MSEPTPNLFFETVKAYQRTAALKSAIELGVFEAIAQDHTNATQLAKHCQSTERGINILCDYLTVKGFLNKSNNRYQLTPDSETFLNPKSTEYLGSAIDFLLSEPMLTAFQNLTTAVQKGGTALPQEGTLAPDHPAWTAYAKGMAPVMKWPAQLLAEYLDPKADRPLNILDIAAGHALFGLAFAQRNTQATVTALDWPNVLTVAQTHAEEHDLLEQFKTLSGNAFETEFTETYDITILANILHHFNQDTCITLLKKVHNNLNQSGRVAILEFIPNNDRISPPEDASFALVMLATTPQGNVYTFDELNTMCLASGFSRTESHALGHGEQQVVIGHK